jgi:hypothetical protein
MAKSKERNKAMTDNTIHVEDINPHIFTVDDKEYEIFDFRHMTDSQEIKFNRLRHRESRWANESRELIQKLSECSDDKEAEKLELRLDELQGRIMDVRDEFIKMMTNLPDTTLAALSSYNKGFIVSAVAKLSEQEVANAQDDTFRAEED